jgi:hypothetical protein
MFRLNVTVLRDAEGDAQSERAVLQTRANTVMWIAVVIVVLIALIVVVTAGPNRDGRQQADRAQRH